MVSEGLQEVESKSIAKRQLRNIIKDFKMDRILSINTKQLDLTELFQYTVYTLLKKNIVEIKVRCSTTLERLAHHHVCKVGTY